MGCFSFICKECGEAILSNSHRGEKTELFLLKNGEIIEHMSGEYDSYGRVFTEDLKHSVKWITPWNDVCDLMFDDMQNNGIAAIHTKCYEDVLPTTRSEGDPNQGWGDSAELLGDVNPDLEYE